MTLSCLVWHEIADVSTFLIDSVVSLYSRVRTVTTPLVINAVTFFYDHSCCMFATFSRTYLISALTNVVIERVVSTKYNTVVSTANVQLCAEYCFANKSGTMQIKR